MATAHEVATDLRVLADALDKEPEAVIVEPTIYFSCNYRTNGREMFHSLARILPRPLAKDWKPTEVWLRYDGKAITVNAYIDRGKVCTLVEEAKPAVYKCDDSILKDIPDA